MKREILLGLLIGGGVVAAFGAIIWLGALMVMR